MSLNELLVSTFCVPGKGHHKPKRGTGSLLSQNLEPVVREPDIKIFGGGSRVEAGGRLDLVRTGWSHRSPEGVSGVYKRPEPFGGSRTWVLDLPWLPFSCGALSNCPVFPGSPLSWQHIDGLNHLKPCLPSTSTRLHHTLGRRQKC